MSAKHTPGPYREDGLALYAGKEIILHAGGLLGAGHRLDEQVANVERAAICMDVCAGMEHPADEIAALKAEATRWQREYSRCFADLCGEQTKARGFKRERDELLEALKHVTACLESYVSESDDEHRFCTQARAAIAKAEGRPQ